MDTRLIFRDHRVPFEQSGDADGMASMPIGHGVFLSVGGSHREIHGGNTEGWDG